jgi:(S)-sulfolactate dehydrogenase
MDVSAFDPGVPADDPAWSLPTGGVENSELADILERSDIVSLHVPLTPLTRDMIGSQAIARMKRGAVLINAARGGIVDEPALVGALKSGHLAGAALDVFAEEPLSAASGAVFAGCPNLLLTPHVAGDTRESNRRVAQLTAENVRRHLTRA